jgi:hypothetical protein
VSNAFGQNIRDESIRKLCNASSQQVFIQPAENAVENAHQSKELIEKIENLRADA